MKTVQQPSTSTEAAFPCPPAVHICCLHLTAADDQRLTLLDPHHRVNSHDPNPLRLLEAGLLVVLCGFVFLREGEALVFRLGEGCTFLL